jgi:hypothetical protein
VPFRPCPRLDRHPSCIQRGAALRHVRLCRRLGSVGDRAGRHYPAGHMGACPYDGLRVCQERSEKLREREETAGTWMRSGGR